MLFLGLGVYGRYGKMFLHQGNGASGIVAMQVEMMLGYYHMKHPFWGWFILIFVGVLG
jgi:hypothetical protein